MTALEYEIRVAGSVPASVLEEIDDVRIVSHSVQTVLRGPVPDQAALIDIIDRLQGWGIDVHAIRQLAPAPDPSPGPARVQAEHAP